MGLLETMEQSKVGQDHALVLCDQYEFSQVSCDCHYNPSCHHAFADNRCPLQGRLHLLMERPGMHRQILVQHMDDQNFQSLIQDTSQ